MRDHVDQLVAGWSRERPDLDVEPITVVYRLTRVAASWNQEIERFFADEGMTPTDFAVLANLRRAGPPYQQTQRQLMTALRLSSGTISLRIDKLVARRLVERRADPDDARASRVTLTDAGRKTFDEVAPRHLANEARLAATLPSEQRATLSDLLRTLLIEIEQPRADRPDELLGFVATPAPDAHRKRTELGLAPLNGLLVEQVRNGSAAHAAGLLMGDVITRVGTTPLAALTCLERALAEPASTVAVTVIRNGAEMRLSIPRT